jgi:DNA repair protein RecO (recombination protein O)
MMKGYLEVEWRGEGILLKVRRHGESSSIIEVFTECKGRHIGVVRGGTSRKIAPILQPGAQLHVSWRARLEEHIGSFTAESLRSRTALVMDSRLALAGLNAVTALLSFCLPEREQHVKLYNKTEQLMDLLGQDELWPLAYLQWEMALLNDMGYGLDLSKCAVTGLSENLIYVSPKSGRAVSENGAGEWADRLLPLPPVLRGEGDASNIEIAKAFETTGYFLCSRMASNLGSRPLPDARAQFITIFLRSF